MTLFGACSGSLESIKCLALLWSLLDELYSIYTGSAFSLDLLQFEEAVVSIRACSHKDAEEDSRRAPKNLI